MIFFSAFFVNGFRIPIYFKCAPQNEHFYNIHIYKFYIAIALKSAWNITTHLTIARILDGWKHIFIIQSISPRYFVSFMDSCRLWTMNSIVFFKSQFFTLFCDRNYMCSTCGQELFTLTVYRIQNQNEHGLVRYEKKWKTSGFCEW